MGLTSDLSQEELARAVAAARSGKPLSDGPILTVFQPEALADAIERECARTAHLPNQKIDLRMDPIDAMLLAKFLRFRTVG